MTKAPPAAYSVEELAAFFDCSDDTISERLASGDLPGLKIGRSWVIPSEAFHERLNEKAREEAKSRRAIHQVQAPAPSAAKPSTVHVKPAGRRAARIPPALPALATAVQPGLRS